MLLVSLHGLKAGVVHSRDSTQRSLSNLMMAFRAKRHDRLLCDLVHPRLSSLC
jgi:hypothetical protein